MRHLQGGREVDCRFDDMLGRAGIRLPADIDDVAACWLSAVARASTAKAFSSPMRSKAAPVWIIVVTPLGLPTLASFRLDGMTISNFKLERLRP